jgi:predicted GIY-YIG superfamily endonuclease
VAQNKYLTRACSCGTVSLMDKIMEEPKFADWFERVFEPEMHVVYVMYDRCGCVLYVGVTTKYGFKSRIRYHYANLKPEEQDTSFVKREVDRIEFLSEHHTRSGALLAERDTISDLQPEYNINWNGDGLRVRKARSSG